MLWICPATGHVVDRHSPAEAFCPQHGVALFRECPKCGVQWPTTTTEDAFDYSDETYPTDGTNFCNACGTPASWLERADLMVWVRNQVKASMDLTSAARVELIAVLDPLKEMEPSDDKAIPVWGSAP
jgi:hypothetical protein